MNCLSASAPGKFKLPSSADTESRPFQAVPYNAVPYNARLSHGMPCLSPHQARRGKTNCVKFCSEELFAQLIEQMQSRLGDQLVVEQSASWIARVIAIAGLLPDDPLHCRPSEQHWQDGLE
jgi:hypothetical protein